MDLDFIAEQLIEAVEEMDDIYDFCARDIILAVITELKLS